MAQVYAVYFNRDFHPGEHWLDDVLPAPADGEAHVPGTHRPRADDSDRKQHWQKGQLFSEATAANPDLLPCFTGVFVEKAEGQVWDAQQLCFVDPPTVVYDDDDVQHLHDRGFTSAAAALAAHKEHKAATSRKPKRSR